HPNGSDDEQLPRAAAHLCDRRTFSVVQARAGRNRRLQRGGDVYGPRGFRTVGFTRHPCGDAYSGNGECGDLWNAHQRQGGTALAELWTSSLVGVQEARGEDRIGVVRGAVVIFTTPAAALLLSAPRAGLDDGKELTIIDGSGYAHVVTTPTNGINGAWNTIT